MTFLQGLIAGIGIGTLAFGIYTWFLLDKLGRDIVNDLKRRGK